MAISILMIPSCRTAREVCCMNCVKYVFVRLRLGLNQNPPSRASEVLSDIWGSFMAQSFLHALEFIQQRREGRDADGLAHRISLPHRGDNPGGFRPQVLNGAVKVRR